MAHDIAENTVLRAPPLISAVMVVKPFRIFVNHVPFSEKTAVSLLEDKIRLESTSPQCLDMNLIEVHVSFKRKGIDI